MMKRLLSLLLALAAPLALAGCGGTAAVKTENRAVWPKAPGFEDYDAQWEIREQNPVQDRTIQSANDFAYASAEALLSAEEQNRNYSPLSLYYALSLLALGASGETEAELCDVLHIADKAAGAEELGRLMRRLYADNEGAKLKIANSLWLQGNVSFRDAFLAAATEELYADLFSVDFAEEDTARRMAAWVRDNTSNLEPGIQTSPEQILAILNTVDYRACWYDEFLEENNQLLPFRKADGSAVDAEFMVQRQGVRSYARGEGFTRAALGLNDGGRMVFVLPDADTTLNALLSGPGGVRELLAGGEAHDAEITYRIPKFSFDSEFDLIDMLKELGVTSAFSGTLADFSDMSQLPACVTQICQQTHVDVNEEGVAASAFTMIAVNATCMPPEGAEPLDFTLDRPFLYGIYGQDGALLFVGTVYSPAA